MSGTLLLGARARASSAVGPASLGREFPAAPAAGRRRPRTANVAGPRPPVQAGERSFAQRAWIGGLGSAMVSRVRTTEAG